jgi:hypothetical protein
MFGMTYGASLFATQRHYKWLLNWHFEWILQFDDGYDDDHYINFDWYFSIWSQLLEEAYCTVDRRLNGNDPPTLRLVEVRPCSHRRFKVEWVELGSGRESSWKIITEFTMTATIHCLYAMLHTWPIMSPTLIIHRRSFILVYGFAAFSQDSGFAGFYVMDFILFIYDHGIVPGTSTGLMGCLMHIEYGGGIQFKPPVYVQGREPYWNSEQAS